MGRTAQQACPHSVVVSTRSEREFGARAVRRVDQGRVRQGCRGPVRRYHERARGDRRADRGAVLVEAAIVIPLVLLLVFGALEFSLAFKESGTVESAARAGARTASTFGRTDEWDIAPRPPADPTLYGDATRRAVASVVEGIGSGDPVEMWVYKAQPGGDPASGSVEDRTCDDCAGWSWDGDGFDTAINGFGSWWDEDDQNACRLDAEHIGVYVKVRYEHFTGLFGDGRDLTSRAVMRFEPFVGEGDCAPGP